MAVIPSYLDNHLKRDYKFVKFIRSFNAIQDISKDIPTKIWKEIWEKVWKRLLGLRSEEEFKGLKGTQSTLRTLTRLQ